VQEPSHAVARRQQSGYPFRETIGTVHPVLAGDLAGTWLRLATLQAEQAEVSLRSCSAAGIIEYDTRNGTVRCRGDPALGTLLDMIATWATETGQ